MIIKTPISAIIVLLVAFWVNAQQVVPNEVKCEQSLANGVSAPQEKPVVLLGSEYTVPALRFRFANMEATSKLPSTIRVFYVWEWLEYPYPKHSWGAWSEAYDIVDCTNTDKLEVVLPAYKVIPKGWYSGKYSRTPRFDHIEVSFDTKDCGTPRLLFNKREIEKFKKMTAFVSLPCGGWQPYKWVRNDFR